ncbi:MAG: hypothetical protein ACR2NZ_13775, partial [Rubripirellula sp.]
DPVIETAELPVGEYRLLVHDFLFRGGSEFPYQLLIRTPFEGADVMETEPGLQEEVGPSGRLPKWWAPNAAAMRRPVLNQVSEVTERQSLKLPTDKTWWFATDQSDRVFELDASKGQKVSIDVRSERLGEPSDARLIVQRIESQSDGVEKYHDIANADDSDSVGDAAVSLVTRDPHVTWVAPVDARYRLVVRDLDRGRALRLRKKFQLRAGTPRPSFDLVAYRVFPNKDVNQSRGFGSKLFRGGTEAIRVLALRRDGWAGPIRLKVKGLPKGVTASEVSIAANQNQTQITLTASEDVAQFDELATHARVEVSGTSEDGSVTSTATPLSLVWGRGGGREFIRSRISTGLEIAVSRQDLAPISIHWAAESTPEVKKGASLTLPIQLTRREGGKAACVLRPRDLPPGITAAEVKVPADKSEGNLVLKVSGKAVAGTYSLWLQAETKIKLKPDPQRLERTQAYRSHLQTLHDDPAQASQVDAIKAAIAAADKQVESAKADAKEQEQTVFIPTSNATFTVVDP